MVFRSDSKPAKTLGPGWTGPENICRLASSSAQTQPRPRSCIFSFLFSPRTGLDARKPEARDRRLIPSRPAIERARPGRWREKKIKPQALKAAGWPTTIPAPERRKYGIDGDKLGPAGSALFAPAWQIHCAIQYGERRRACSHMLALREGGGAWRTRATARSLAAAGTAARPSCSILNSEAPSPW